MTAKERNLFKRLVKELSDLSSAFYRAAGCEADAALRKLYRNDFRRWDRLLKAARTQLDKNV